METGTLNERIQIYEPKAERNLTSLDDYELSGTVWANVRSVTPRDQMRSGIDVQSGQITVLIRYLSGLSDDFLIRWKNQFFSIDNLSADRHMGNSPLVSYTKLSPNHSGKRPCSISRITPHAVVGQLSVERICDCFKDSSRQASYNYAIGADGRIGLCVDEQNCSSSRDNDQRAVTINAPLI